MNLLHNYTKYAGKRDRKRKKAKETRTIKMSQNGDKCAMY